MYFIKRTEFANSYNLKYYLTIIYDNNIISFCTSFWMYYKYIDCYNAMHKNLVSHFYQTFQKRNRENKQKKNQTKTVTCFNICKFILIYNILIYYLIFLFYLILIVYYIDKEHCYDDGHILILWPPVDR